MTNRSIVGLTLTTLLSLIVEGGGQQGGGYKITFGEGHNKITLGEDRKSTLKKGGGVKIKWGGGGWIFVVVRAENMLVGEQQRRKARERKTRKQTKLKNNVNVTAVLNDDNFNEL